MMHCILVKFKPEVQQEAELFSRIFELFFPLTDMEGIDGVEVIPNVIDRPNRYDLLIRIEMEEEALESYDESEIHHRWKREYGGLLEKKAIFDYEA